MTIDRYAWCDCALIARTTAFRIVLAVLIVAHVAILATYEPRESQAQLRSIVIADYCFSVVFIAEFFTRLAAKGSSAIRDAYMYVDFVSMVLSVASFVMLLPVLTEDANPVENDGVWRGFLVLSFRAARLLRALKVIPPVKHLLQTAFARGIALANLICLIFVALAAFALVCMQLFGGRLDVSDEAPAPRLVFDTF